MKHYSLLLAIAMVGLFVFFWEQHWRTKGYPIAPEDDKHLWAKLRNKVETLDGDDVVLIGSSRVLFDIQVHAWESITGRKPIMLAAAGANPNPVFEDLAYNSTFRGTLVVGITSHLYFSPQVGENGSWARIRSWTEHSHSRTWADRLNHELSQPLQGSFAFLNATEEDFFDELDLRTLIKRIPHPTRVPGWPLFPQFQYLDADRNTTMWRADVDTAIASLVTETWAYAMVPPPPEKMPSPEEIEAMRVSVIEKSAEFANAIRERGGQVIFVRLPYSGAFSIGEPAGFPRDQYWQPLVDAAKAPSYHFMDHEFMQGYDLPEWSHMKQSDAYAFTLDLVNRLKSDGLIHSN